MARRYLARENTVEIDPVELKLGSEVFKTALLGGMFGALRDASPDYWRCLIIDRAAGKVTHDEIDYLLLQSAGRSGGRAPLRA